MKVTTRRATLTFDQLVFAPGNPNSMSKSDYGQLVCAIEETGQLLQPILVRPFDAGARYVVVDGENRAYACRDAGVPIEAVIAEGLSDAQAKALRIGMAKLRGSLEIGKVGDEVRAIVDLSESKTLGAELASVIGFDASELDAILASSSTNMDHILGGARSAGDEDAPQPSRGETKPRDALLTVRFKTAEDRNTVRTRLAELDADPAVALLLLVKHEEQNKRKKGRPRTGR